MGPMGLFVLTVPDRRGLQDLRINTTTRGVTMCLAHQIRRLLINIMRQPKTLVGCWLLVLSSQAALANSDYAWHDSGTNPTITLEQAMAPPPGFVRQAVAPNSWAAWLRGLPMKPSGSPVMLYNGIKKPRQDVHAGVIDIDVGRRDLQQCADAIMRLRAEWLFANKRPTRIAFNDTKGRPMRYSVGRGASYKSFRKYMIRVFAYAGTYSLERELQPKSMSEIAIGDVVIKGGFPGHAVLVVDMAVNPNTKTRKFLLSQSYMPAQDIHILKNPSDPTGGPWYDVRPGERLKTPEWEFAADALRTWPSR